MNDEMSREDLIYEFNKRMEDIQTMKDECGKNLRNLENSAEDFERTTIEVDRILEEIRLSNIADKEFIRDLDMAISEIESAKYESKSNFNIRYEELLDQEQEYSYMEEECMNEYKSLINDEKYI